jgi:hypothetical protein
MTDLFRNTIGPWGWALMAAIPLGIFALYFLKLRRQPLEVPSTYLWTKVIEDLHVNSFWQRLRRSLLLFLQLLLVGLAILALLRPGWLGESLSGQRFIFLVDRSASMSATDAEGGKSRLEASKERVADLVDQLESDMSAMIIAFDDQPTVVQEFTNNRRLLRDAVERIEPTAKPTNLRGALEMAAGFATSSGGVDSEAEESAAVTDDVELYIFSDGRFDAISGISLASLQPKYLPFGSTEANNAAITAFSVSRNESRPELRQAFVQVANFSDEPASVVIELSLDGQLLDATKLEVPAADAAGATFSIAETAVGTLKASLGALADYGDELALDNTAFAVLDKHQKTRVLLVTPGNRSLELGLSTERAQRLGTVEKISPEAIGTPEFKRDMQSEKYDLVIFDQCAPEKAEDMPQANTLFIGRLPPLETWKAESSMAPVALPQIIDWQRSHPLLNLVELGNIAIYDSLIVEPPTGGKALIDSTKGPIAAIGPRESFEDAVVGFEIVGRDEAGQTTVNTNWPRRLSFPNFCLNALSYLAGAAADAQRLADRPGKSVEIDLSDSADNLTVVLPDKSTRRVESPTTGKLVFHETDQLGPYEVRSGSEPVARFAVNLFDRQESDVRLRAQADEATGLKTVQALSIGYTDVQAQSPSLPVRKELWTWVLLAVLAVLVFEWYIYNRRVYV